jgi:hypothetical protein
VNFLVERSSKTSPEDWRRLQQEREGLGRQLSVEKEAHQKAQEENRGLRQEKSRLEEQVRSSQFVTEKRKCLQFSVGISIASNIIFSFIGHILNILLVLHSHVFCLISFCLSS